MSLSQAADGRQDRVEVRPSWAKAGGEAALSVNARGVNALEFRGITKEFSGVEVLHGIDLEIRRGEVHAIVGENGAGKSTLMKLLAGVHTPTSGQILLHGQRVEIRGPQVAKRLGIAMIHQELNLAEDLSVEENIFLGWEITRMRLLDRRAMRARAAELLASLETPIDPRARVSDLTVAEKQMVEIAKAIAHEASVLIMDEPTAVLTEHETQILMELVRRLRDGGVTILYISHKLPEVKAIADRVTVLRDGHLVTTRPASELTEEEIARLMVGRELSQMFPPKEGGRSAVALEVRNLSVPGYVEMASFDVREGEVVGFAGLIGAGRTELAEAVVGLRPRLGGEVRLFGQPFHPRSYGEALRAGIAYLPEDRKASGIIGEMALQPNLTLSSLKQYCHPFIDTKQERRSLVEAVERFDIRAPSLDSLAETLSGGNQQKVVLAKILATRPRVIILDEPTRGIDVGTKQQFYFLIHELARSGLACVVISSELPEVIGLANRVFVMRTGRLVAELTGDQIREDEIMLFATGVKEAQPA